MISQIFSTNSRATSPVVGAVLMVSISVMLAAVMGAASVTGIGQATDAPPQASFSYEVTDDGVEVTHDGGDDLDGSRLGFAGAALEKNETGTITEWQGETVTGGDSAVVETTSGTLKLVWVASSGDTSSTLDAASVPATGPDVESTDPIFEANGEEGPGPGVQEAVETATP